MPWISGDAKLCVQKVEPWIAQPGREWLTVRDRGPRSLSGALTGHTVWLDRASNRFRFLRPSSFNTALQLVLRPHFLVYFV
jgi:hypothetical protein